MNSPSRTPKQSGFRQPGEWTPHRACWVAFPSDPELWPDLAGVQASFATMCRGIARPSAKPDVSGPQSEALELLVRDAAAEARARELLSDLEVRYHRMSYGDIWMRDIAPVFLTDASGEVASVRFRFNGWGEKYDYPGDTEVAARVQDQLQYAAFQSSLVLEGGGVESDGAGLCMTTRDVALNPNRNPGRSEAEVEAELKEALGAERVIWLDQGLLNDHTDGHIDNIARFIAPGRVVCMRAQTADDPNVDVLASIEGDLRKQGLEVVTLPSPGLVLGREQRPLPASYLNFYIANHSVVVPVFGSPHDEAALTALAALFPNRTVVPVPAKVFLEEGGTVHCITQQEPQRSSERTI
ncbi:MAG: agmatine deiminase family protein [Myxococcales bacterium]